MVPNVKGLVGKTNSNVRKSRLVAFKPNSSPIPTHRYLSSTGLMMPNPFAVRLETKIKKQTEKEEFMKTTPKKVKIKRAKINRPKLFSDTPFYPAPKFPNNAFHEPFLTPNKNPSFLNKQACQLTEVAGLIGVEYVLRIVNDQNVQFECTLCEKTSDELFMQKHLCSNIHRIKYIDRHYPTSLIPIRSYVNTPELYCHIADLLERMAKAIEAHHGREEPLTFPFKTYLEYKYDICNDLQNVYHANEMNGPSFTDVFTARDIVYMKLFLNAFSSKSIFKRSIDDTQIYSD